MSYEEDYNNNNGGGSQGGHQGGGFGGGYSRPQTRPGDWICDECGGHNFASRTACYKCHAPRRGAPPDSFSGFGAGAQYGASRSQPFRDGDWNCSECNAHNFASRRNCYQCGAPGGNGGGGQSGGFGNRGGYGGRGGGWGGNNYGSRPGDWLCPDCGVNNFASRQECFKCRCPRPEGGPGYGGGAPVSSLSSYGDRGGFGGSEDTRREVRPGDWECGECGGNNFASRVACYRCQAPRPGY